MVGNDAIDLYDYLGYRAFSPAWVDRGAVYNGQHLWVAAWLLADELPESGHVIERFQVSPVSLQDCDGNDLTRSFSGTSDIYTISYFREGYADSFRGMSDDIYTVFINTDYHSHENLIGCNKGEIEIRWAYRVYESMPSDDIRDRFDPPLDPREAWGGSDTNERVHKPHSDDNPLPEGLDNGLIESDSFIINISWDWCGGFFSSRSIEKTPRWTRGPNRPGR